MIHLKEHSIWFVMNKLFMSCQKIMRKITKTPVEVLLTISLIARLMWGGWRRTKTMKCVDFGGVFLKVL